MSDHQKGSPDWERETIARLASASLVEQRRARRWGILFKALGLLYLFALLFIFLGSTALFERKERGSGPHTALININGVIMAGTDASADRIAGGLRRAFGDSDTRAIILRIDSPGGSPVQAGQIYDEIRRLRAKHPDIPVHAVAGDLLASGGYYIAAAADDIYVNQASLVGSIGVIFGGFGFVDAIDNLGIERRVITAGDNKALFDPFLPEQPAHAAHLQEMVGYIHDQFIKAVTDGRGDRLADDDQLFSGLVWTGEVAIAKGLADHIGSAGYVAREVVGVDRIVDFTPRRDLFERVAERIGAGVATALGDRVLPALR